jgi:hypothetical protein
MWRVSGKCRDTNFLWVSAKNAMHDKENGALGFTESELIAIEMGMERL